MYRLFMLDFALGGFIWQDYSPTARTSFRGVKLINVLHSVVH